MKKVLLFCLPLVFITPIKYYEVHRFNVLRAQFDALIDYLEYTELQRGVECLNTFGD